jgi:ABC-type transport system involved in cytochrome bd biosynthesis fused ATPase/permease subunit
MPHSFRFLSLKKLKPTKSNLFYLSVFGLYLAALAIDPRLMLAPMTLHAIKALNRLNSQLIKMSRSQRSFSLLVVIFLMVLGTAIPSHAIAFSLLLNSTEKMLETCVFSQVTGMKVLSGLVFAGIRGTYMFSLVGEAQEWREKSKHNQNASESVKGIVGMIVGLIVLGVVEPFLSKSC